KRLLHEAVVLPQQCPSLFQGVRQPWKGILLYGPPGTGKTQLAKAIAGESRATFMLLSPSNLLSKFVGEAAERALSRVFAFAKDKAPTCWSVEQIDAIGSSRGSGDQALRRLLAELLQQFSSLKPSDRVVVLAATNRIEDIDPALLRRFERKFHVGLLTGHARGELLRLKMVGTPTAPDLDYKQLGRRTDGFSGASLELLCR
ncbi:P-loop containing nucleoside triphosphate hydrolase protein, partial [Baffinella frigidus]